MESALKHKVAGVGGSAGRARIDPAAELRTDRRRLSCAPTSAGSATSDLRRLSYLRPAPAQLPPTRAG